MPIAKAFVVIDNEPHNLFFSEQRTVARKDPTPTHICGPWYLSIGRNAKGEGIHLFFVDGRRGEGIDGRSSCCLRATAPNLATRQKAGQRRPSSLYSVV